jgi:hypothetical protein
VPLHRASAFLFGLLLLSSSAAAQTLRLHWDAPSGCPTVGAIRTEVEQLSGRAYPDDDRAETDAHGVVAAEPDGTWSGEIHIQSPQGHAERRIAGSTCEAVSHAAASIIALAIEPPPDGPPRVVSKLTVADRLPPPVPAVRDRPVTPTRSAQTNPKGLKWHARVLGGTDTLDLPKPTEMFEAAVGVTIEDAIEADLSFGYLVPRQTDVPGASASVSLWFGGVSGCWQHRLGAEWRVGPCLGLEVGRRQVESSAPIAAQAARLWIAPVVAMGLSRELTAAWWLPVRLELAAPLRRERFTLEGVGVVNQAPAMTFRAIIGIEARSP